MSRIILHIILILLLCSCERAIDWELDTQTTSVLVVEGMVTNENDYHSVSLSRTRTGINATPEYVSGAYVVIYDGELAIRLRENPAGSGIYLPSEKFRGVYGKTYSLYIRLDSEVYTASSRMVPVKPLQPLQYKSHPEHPNFYRILLNDSEDPSMIDYELDWSRLATPGSAAADSSHARIVHYTLQTFDVNQMFKPDKESVYFPVGTIVRRSKHSLSVHQQEFIRTMMAETEWRGGLFDVQPGNVKTNLSEGAIGYFAASTVVSDTTLILPLK